MEDAPRMLKSKKMERKSAAWELERDALLSPEPGKLQINSMGRPNRFIPSLQHCRQQPLSRGICRRRDRSRVFYSPYTQVMHPAPSPGHTRVNSSAAQVERKSFQGLSTLFADKRSSWPTDEEEPQPRRVCFADSVSGVALLSVFGFIVTYFIPLGYRLLPGINQAGLCRGRTKLNDYNSENYYNLLIIVFASILPHTIWSKKSLFFHMEGILCR